VEGFPLAEGIRGELLGIASLLVLDRLDRGWHGRVRMFIERLGKTEQSYGFWFEWGGMSGTRPCFYVSPPRRGRHYGATGVGTTSRLARRCQAGCFHSNLVTGLRGPKPEHACAPCETEKRRCQTAIICPRGYIQISTNKSCYMQRNHPCVYLSHCFSADDLVHKPGA